MQVKHIRQNKLKNHKLESIYNEVNLKCNNEWLLKYEILELAYKKIKKPWVKKLYKDLEKLTYLNNDFSNALKRGLYLLDK